MRVLGCAGDGVVRGAAIAGRAPRPGVREVREADRSEVGLWVDRSGTQQARQLDGVRKSPPRLAGSAARVQALVHFLNEVEGVLPGRRSVARRIGIVAGRVRAVHVAEPGEPGQVIRDHSDRAGLEAGRGPRHAQLALAVLPGPSTRDRSPVRVVAQGLPGDGKPQGPRVRPADREHLVVPEALRGTADVAGVEADRPRPVGPVRRRGPVHLGSRVQVVEGVTRSEPRCDCRVVVQTHQLGDVRQPPVGVPGLTGRPGPGVDPVDERERVQPLDLAGTGRVRVVGDRAGTVGVLEPHQAGEEVGDRAVAVVREPRVGQRQARQDVPVLPGPRARDLGPGLVPTGDLPRPRQIDRPRRRRSEQGKQNRERLSWHGTPPEGRAKPGPSLSKAQDRPDSCHRRAKRQEAALRLSPAPLPPTWLLPRARPRPTPGRIARGGDPT